MRVAYYTTPGPARSLEVPEPPAQRVRRGHHPGGDPAEGARQEPEGRTGHADGGYHVAVGVADRGGHRVEPDLVLPLGGRPAAHADLRQLRAEQAGVDDGRDGVALESPRKHSPPDLFTGEREQDLAAGGRVQRGSLADPVVEAVGG